MEWLRQSLTTLVASAAIAGFWPAKSFWWVRWSILPLVAVVLLFSAASRGLWPLDRRDYLIIAFCAWAALSGLWAADGYTYILALERLFIFTAIWLAGRRASRSWIAYTALLVAVCVLSIDLYARFAISYPSVVKLYSDILHPMLIEQPMLLFGGQGNVNDQAQVLLMAIPLMYFLPVRQVWVRAVIQGVTLWALVILFFFSTSNMPKWVLLICVTSFTIWWVWRERLVQSALLAIGVVVLLGFSFDALDPFSLYDQFVASHLNPRLQLWAASVHMGITYPSGVGFGMFDIWWSEFNRSYELIVPWATSDAFEDLVRPGAAHGDFFQIFAELGIVGFALAAWFVISCWRKDAAWSEIIPAVVAISLALIDFPLQKPATALLATMALVLLAGSPRRALR